MASPTAFTGSIPANYEKYLGPVLFEPYAIDLAQRVQKTTPRKVLEIACGTGRVTKQLLQQVRSVEELVATDINADMIAVAKQLVHDEKLSWVEADALNLPFADDTFDAVVCQFGVMFFPDKEKGFKEMCRVLRRGGTLLFNTWGSPEENPRVVHTIKVVKDVLKDEAPDFLEKGPYSFYNEELIRPMLAKAGFDEMICTRVEKISKYPDLQNLVNGFIEGSPLSSYLEKFSAHKREELHEKLYDEFAALEEKGLEHPMLALVFECRK